MGDSVSEWDGALPVSGDYYLMVASALAPYAKEYSLEVDITNTDEADPPGGPAKRIRIASGATGAEVGGTVEGEGIERWVLRARKGQRLGIALISLPSGDLAATFPESCRSTCVAASVTGPGGEVMAETLGGWEATVPEDGDYVIEVGSALAPYAKDYVLHIRIDDTVESSASVPGDAIRLSFDPGETSGMAAGTVSEGEPTRFVVGTRAGQQITVTVTSAPSGDLVDAFPESCDSCVLISVAAADGTPLGASLSTWSGTVPADGDYVVTVSSILGDYAKDFELDVSVVGDVILGMGGDDGSAEGGDARSDGDGPESGEAAGEAAGSEAMLPVGTSRITFEGGDTSAGISGSVSEVAARRFLVSASAGQFVSVALSSSPGAGVADLFPDACKNACVAVSVIGPDGMPIGDSLTGWEGVVPADGEYVIEVVSVLAPYEKDFELTVSVEDSGA